MQVRRPASCSRSASPSAASLARSRSAHWPGTTPPAEASCFTGEGARLEGPRSDEVHESIERELMKGSQKPKKLGKKQPQKTLKQRRAEKRQAGKQGRAFDV